MYYSASSQFRDIRKQAGMKAIKISIICSLGGSATLFEKRCESFVSDLLVFLDKAQFMS